MIDREKAARMRALYEAGVCPTCGSSLAKVVGWGNDGHFTDGTLFIGGGGFVADRRDRCPLTTDDLTSLTLVGEGIAANV